MSEDSQKIASEWSVPSFAILWTVEASRQTDLQSSRNRVYQQARPIRIKRGIKEPDDPKNEEPESGKRREKACQGNNGSKEKKESPRGRSAVAVSMGSRAKAFPQDPISSTSTRTGTGTSRQAGKQAGKLGWPFLGVLSGLVMIVIARSFSWPG
ncbi:hypothetical protein FVEG_15091 [Fusarium verticillioides 7600]|uniref:Uncharacterized protein n=1 Tax=Gibberella moniliformis (strain M3125 / FGSC 7600) TaxID=334819 RepID=W7M4Z0_GIBM7|nr:hypothetical protein FVEG_15091 [Fusarium verticillioides 7600]EWG39932.1 hypothetical protein FVEG_15091 [Fusarium verticillioides 7600]